MCSAGKQPRASDVPPCHSRPSKILRQGLECVCDRDNRQNTAARFSLNPGHAWESICCANPAFELLFIGTRNGLQHEERSYENNPKDILICILFQTHASFVCYLLNCGLSDSPEFDPTIPMDRYALYKKLMCIHVYAGLD